MLHQLLIFIFVLAKCTTATSIPLLDENVASHTWTLTPEAETILMKYQNEFVHIVAVGGPTRTGKSFVMGKILEKVVDNGGKIHFGAFVHRNQLESVTKGMYIALVEFKNAFILLLDCEGLGSVTKDMDPRLMVTMAMISQKMLYMNKIFDTHTVDEIATMIFNRNTACDTTGVPLDTMYFVLNQYTLERNPNFLQEKLNTEEYFDIKCIINHQFPIQKTFFIGKEKKKSSSAKKQFDADIETLFRQLMGENVEPFAINGVRLNIRKFVVYLKGVLEQVSSNKKISFPNLIQATYEQFARNKIDELRTKLKYCKKFHNESELQNRLLEIDSDIQEFEQECESYKNQIKEVYYNFLNELKDFKYKFEQDNERIGDEVESTDTEIKKTLLCSGTNLIQKESNGVFGGAVTGCSTGASVGGGFGAFFGAVAGGIVGLCNSEKEIKTTVTTYCVTQVITHKLKNGKTKTEEKALGNVTNEE